MHGRRGRIFQQRFWHRFMHTANHIRNSFPRQRLGRSPKTPRSIACCVVELLPRFQLAFSLRFCILSRWWVGMCSLLMILWSLVYRSMMIWVQNKVAWLYDPTTISPPLHDHLRSFICLVALCDCVTTFTMLFEQEAMQTRGNKGNWGWTWDRPPSILK